MHRCCDAISADRRFFSARGANSGLTACSEIFKSGNRVRILASRAHLAGFRAERGMNDCATMGQGRALTSSSSMLRETALVSLSIIVSRKVSRFLA